MTLFPEQVSICDPIGDWAYEDELGAEIFPVPNRQKCELGTGNILAFPVPNLVPNLPVGCLEQKVIKSKFYWYWRYYKVSGAKRSVYLSSDYNKAIAKAKAIGVPKDAKLPRSRNSAASTKAQI
jgi:hypothetical protein